MVNVEVFSSPGCGKCAQAKTLLQAVAQELGSDKVRWREVNILEEMDYAVDLGIMSTPAIAIDGKLAYSSLPRPDQLRAELARRLA